MADETPRSSTTLVGARSVTGSVASTGGPSSAVWPWLIVIGVVLALGLLEG
jgi:hypothetical protein